MPKAPLPLLMPRKHAWKWRKEAGGQGLSLRAGAASQTDLPGIISDSNQLWCHCQAGSEGEGGKPTGKGSGTKLKARSFLGAPESPSSPVRVYFSPIQEQDGVGERWKGRETIFLE
jgi:hypothetical protein